MNNLSIVFNNVDDGNLCFDTVVAFKYNHCFHCLDVLTLSTFKGDSLLFKMSFAKYKELFYIWLDTGVIDLSNYPACDFYSQYV